MDLPTYTNIWRIEKRLYKIYDFRLPIPLPIGQIVVFVAITVPYIMALTLVGLPFNHSLFWLYILPPGVATWLATRPVLENKRLPELLGSQIRYLAEPRMWCRMTPAGEPDEIVIVGRVWHREPRMLMRRARPAITTVTAAHPASAGTDRPGTDGGVAERRVSPWPSTPARRRVPSAARAVGMAVATGPATTGVAGLPGGGGTAGVVHRAGVALPAGANTGPDKGTPDKGTPNVGTPNVGTGDTNAGNVSGSAGGSAPGSVGSRTAGGAGSGAAGTPAGTAPGPVPKPSRTSRRGAASGAAGTLAGTAPGPVPKPSRAGHRQTRLELAHSDQADEAPHARGAIPDLGRPDVASGSGQVWVGQARQAKDPVDRRQRYPQNDPRPRSQPQAGTPRTPWQPLRGRSSPPAQWAQAVPQPGQTQASLHTRPQPRPTGQSQEPRAASQPRAESPVAGAAPTARAPAPAAPPSTAAASTPLDPARQTPPGPSPIPRVSESPPPPAAPVVRAVEGPDVSGTTVLEPREQPRSVERVVHRSRDERGPGWHRRAKVVVGGMGPGRADPEEQDKARCRMALPGPRRIVVLGCTSGAGQTATALMLGQLLASLRAEPVAALDLNPGEGSLARQLGARPAATVGALLADGFTGSLSGNDGEWVSADPRLEVITSGEDWITVPALDEHDYIELAGRLAGRYELTIVDPAATTVARVLRIADQLVLVAPASTDAPRAVAMTYEWLEGHSHTQLAARAVTVINGVSKRRMPDVLRAESMARGRCRAIVRVPWDEQLDAERGQEPGPGSVRPHTRHAYTALAGVTVAGLAVAEDAAEAAR